MEGLCQCRPLARRPKPAPAAGPHGGLHGRKGRRPHATARTMCGGSGAQKQGADGAGRTREAVGQQGTAGNGRAGQCGQAHHGSEEVATHVAPSQLAAGIRGGEKPDVTPHALPQGAEPLTAGRSGCARGAKPALHTGGRGPGSAPPPEAPGLARRKGRA